MMNDKISGGKLVLVPIRQLGVNKIPYVEDLRDRIIKYIDFYPAELLPDTDADGVLSSENMYLSVADAIGNEYLIKDMPLQRFDYTSTLGIKQEIKNRISLQNSAVVCQNPANVGRYAALIFWYDLPEFSARNRSDVTIIDSITIPIKNVVRYNPLPDEERLSGRRYRRLLLGMPEKTPEQLNTLSADLLKNVYITLRKGSYNVVENIPVMMFYQLQMLQKSTFANIVFDMQSSYLTVGGAGRAAYSDYVGKSVFMNFVYEK